jgi:hypothetical protein
MNVDVNALAVPEPGSYAMIASLGLTGAAFLRRRRVFVRYLLPTLRRSQQSVFPLRDQ